MLVTIWGFFSRLFFVKSTHQKHTKNTQKMKIKKRKVKKPKSQKIQKNHQNTHSSTKQNNSLTRRKHTLHKKRGPERSARGQCQKTDILKNIFIFQKFFFDELTREAFLKIFLMRGGTVLTFQKRTARVKIKKNHKGSGRECETKNENQKPKSEKKMKTIRVLVESFKNQNRTGKLKKNDSHTVPLAMKVTLSKNSRTYFYTIG